VGAPLDEPEFRRWRAEAGNALGAARREAVASNHNWSCFLAEQSAQLAVKGLLHGLGRGAWGHDLVALVAACGEAGLQVPPAIARAARALSRHYIPARYPDAHPADSPGSRYVADDATAASADAADILAWVDATWSAVRVNPALARRYAEQEQLVGLAREHLATLAGRLTIRRAAVVGSVARGDFNLWSDIDLLVVADALPERLPDRLALLMDDRPARVEVIGFTPAELEAARRRGNPMVAELDAIGIPLEP
jgi:HEPN domain-containing protein